MTVNIFLRRAYNLLLKEFKNPDELWSSGWYKCSIYKDLCYESGRWYFQTRQMLDIHSWNIEKLFNRQHGRIDKPITFTELYLTKKHNLVLDWYPFNYQSEIKALEQSDWVRWTNTVHGQMPYNRLLMIHHYDHLLYSEQWDEIDTCLIDATEQLLRTIFSFLDHFLEIRRNTDLYIDRVDQKPSRIKRIQIRDVKEAIREAKKKRVEEEIESICDEFAFTPEQVVGSFKDNDMKWAPTARELSPSFKKRLSPERLKKLIRNLYYHTNVYTDILDIPPKGFKSKNGIVVKFPGKAK